MKYEEFKALVKGADNQNKPFEMELVFTLIPPREGTTYSGTGCYMDIEKIVRIGDYTSVASLDYVDVRNAGTTNIEILADRWIENYFGSSLTEVRKSFGKKN